MDLNVDAIQSMAIGASGGLPLTLFLLHSMKSLKESFDTFKREFENLSKRLRNVELVLEFTHQKEIKLLQDRIDRVEKAIFERNEKQ